MFLAEDPNVVRVCCTISRIPLARGLLFLEPPWRQPSLIRFHRQESLFFENCCAPLFEQKGHPEAESGDLAIHHLVSYVQRYDLTNPHAIPKYSACPISGEQSYGAIREHILKEFLKRKPAEKPLYSYFTEATDTKNIELVFSASMDIILAKALSSVGFSWNLTGLAAICYCVWTYPIST